MKREWQPGDVAMVTYSVGPRAGLSERVMRSERSAHEWVSPSVNLGSRLRPDAWVADARPLVVIDPEDREAVERLASAVVMEARGYRIDKAIIVVGLTDALREFADPKPTKPAEPTGLGAVVQDARGRTYVRVNRVRVNRVSDYPWIPTETEALSPLAWVDLDDAVEVLSEGVES